ncbi:FdrA family protein [Anaeroselena agilis]|uniref:FdrA family protein n=1 Tax=Anaeroselena agilis TaxID=3063788 RepID=A0ABU3NUM4_9FIRM|nr:FdrA family protein [Selenomonadales bacterium 4137-cl]
MTVHVEVRKNTYYDSVTLMALTQKMAALPGVAEAVAVMATPMNKDLLAGVGLLTAEADACGADDLVVAIRADSDAACEAAVALFAGAAARQSGDKKTAAGFVSLNTAVRHLPDANLAIISVPGEYAAREARDALRHGLNVMLFSDNVSLADEIELKTTAHEKGLLVMGPDCGTAIVNGVALCFANAVRRGNIGIVGASGTGTQEVTVHIDRLGGGISQVLGTGGRDLGEAVGGVMMLDCLEALSKDADTAVIVLISKPPATAVADKIVAAVKTCPKPVVVCFLGGASAVRAEKAYFAATLEEAAGAAVALAKGEQPASPACRHEKLATMAAVARAKLAPGQKTVRGLFCGGTLCQEAARTAPGEGNIFIDLGDDAYTRGKPHPMLEPSLRLPHLLDAARDPAVAVILLDIVLGYGAHPDPAGVTAPAIAEAREIARAAGRHIEIIAYVCGTDADPQGKAGQEGKLAAAGATLAKSNVRAAWLAAAVVTREV